MIKLAYQDVYQEDLIEQLKCEISGDFEAFKISSENELFPTVRVAIKCISYPQKYFAKILRNPVVGLGTDEDALTRVIITRSGIDLQEIKELYLERTNTPLNQDIFWDTSGDYRRFLSTLLGTEEY